MWVIFIIPFRIFSRIFSGFVEADLQARFPCSKLIASADGKAERGQEKESDLAHSLALSLFHHRDSFVVPAVSWVLLSQQ